jgi:Flp pilus assembly protein TadG
VPGISDIALKQPGFNGFQLFRFTSHSPAARKNCIRFHILRVIVMVLESQMRRLRASFAVFVRAEQGNVAVTFALALLPIIGFVGAAVDYSRANYVRSSMQAALDSTALMLSKDAAALTPAQLTQKANAYFNALYTHAEVANIAVTATYTANGPTGSTVQLDGAGSVSTTFLKVAGYSSLPFSSTATATWGNARLRVALALDNTGSMASAGKMDALKPAAKSLIDQLAALAKTPGDVYVSVIPFEKDVNVGPSNFNQNWLRWDLWENQNGSCSNWRYSTKNSCQSHGATWTAGNHTSWNGCVMDRDQNYDVSNTAPVNNTTATQFPPEQDSYCPAAALMPLTYDWTALKARIDQMNPSGSTNQPIGLAWAWQTLSPAPFTYPSEDANYTYSKAIVLMSDGLNTQDRWYGNGYNVSPEVDARQALLCNAVKAANITLYTIQVNTGDDPLSTVLRDCASSPDKFFTVTSANQLLTVFTQIGTSLSKLRLSR